MKDPIVKASPMGTRSELTAQCLQKAKESIVQRSKRYIQNFLNKFRRKPSSKTEIKVSFNAEGRFRLTTTTDIKQKKEIIHLDLPKGFQLEKFEHSDQNTVIEANSIFDDDKTKYFQQHKDTIPDFTENLSKHSNEHGTTDNGKEILEEALTSFKSTNCQNIYTQTAGNREIKKETTRKLQRQLKASGVTFDHDVVSRERNMRENNTFSSFTERTKAELFSEKDLSSDDIKALCMTRMHYGNIVEMLKTLDPHKMKDIILSLGDEMKTKSYDQQLSDRKLFSSEKQNIALCHILTQISLQETNNGINVNMTDELTNIERTYGSVVTADETPSQIQADETPSQIQADETPSKIQAAEIVISKELNSIETRTDLNESYSEEHHDKRTSRQSQPELRQELRKMKQSKPKTRSTNHPSKLAVYTHLEGMETHENISEFLGQSVHNFFGNDTKRPQVTWPSMHPLLQQKVRYLDTSSTERVNVKPTSSPPSSEPSDENDSDESDTGKNIDKTFHPP